MTEYLDRYPTMHEYAEGKRINPKLTDLISRADAIEAVLSVPMPLRLADEIDEVLRSLPSADAEPKWNCTANFVAEQLDRLRNMTDEERWDFFIKFFSPSADRPTEDYSDLPDIPRAYYEKIVGNMAHEINMLKEQLESADAVEVVRCGECKYMIADGRCMEFADDGIRPSATDFCSYGERREKSEVEE